jgi:peptidoglycan-N-acetylglucosamine deacetylase
MPRIQVLARRSLSGRFGLRPLFVVRRIGESVRERLSARRLFATAVVGGILFAADRVDPVAAGIAFLATVCTIAVFHMRTHKAARLAGIAAGIGMTIVGCIAALALPVVASSQDPLIVNVPSEAAPSSAPQSKPLPDIKQRNGMTVLGFAATDYDDTAGGLDNAARYLSVVAATGLTLGRSPGSVVATPMQDSVIRAHIAGARAYAVITNYNGNTFAPKLVDQLVADSDAKSRFVSAITSLIEKDNWDGLVIDFESISPTVRKAFPDLVASVQTALGSKPVLVTVPSFSDPLDEEGRAYDLRALTKAGSGIIWMAYDEHYPGGEPGSIASPDWVKDTLNYALQVVPANKLMLGVPTFGYVWDPKTKPKLAEEITAIEGSRLAKSNQNWIRYDPVFAEMHGTLADGREAWFVDAQGVRIRTEIASDRGLLGVAMWRIGSEEKGTLASLPADVRKENPVAPGRPIITSHKTGVVALTFDDGPDPVWTPQVLAILKKKQVPGTFFIVAKQAEKHPEFVRQMVKMGSVVANHTYSHLDTSTSNEIRNKLDIVAGRAVLEGITGHTPLLFRSPYGSGDSTDNRKGADAIARSLGMHPVGWNVDANDWKKPGVQQIVDQVVSEASERSVVLLHDGGGDRSQTVAALPLIIDRLRSLGYLFSTVDGIDASFGAPYASRTTSWSQARGLAIIAAFRLQYAIRRLFLWIVIGTALIAFLRVALAGPLAIAHLFAQKRRRRILDVVGGGLPSVTVLVPAYNESTVIEKTLLALAACNPRPDRVLVLNDGSTDNTSEVVRLVRDRIHLKNRYPESVGLHNLDAVFIELVDLQNGGKANALNVGIQMATTEVVLVIDADTVVDPSIIGEMAPHFRDPAVGAVAGNVKVGNRRNLLAALQTLEYVISLNLDRRAQDMARIMGVVPGASGAFRRSALLSVGGYPPDTLVEDADLTQSLLRNGWRIPYEPRAIAWTEAPESLRDVVKQRRRWSFGTIQVVNKHKGAIFERKAGVLGFIGLPWMLVTQVALPVLGPFADLYLLYLVLIGAKSQALGILALAFAADMALAIAAVAMDRERPAIVLLAPLMRIVWRPLQLWIVVLSARRFAHGKDETWRKITRRNSVSNRSIPTSSTLADAA